MLVDAPVSGGVAKAANGTLTVRMLDVYDVDYIPTANAQVLPSLSIPNLHSTNLESSKNGL